MHSSHPHVFSPVVEPDAQWTDDVADAFIEEPAAKDFIVEDSVQMYLREIGQDPLLNARQEEELAKRIEAGAFARDVLAMACSVRTANETTIPHPTAADALADDLVRSQNEPLSVAAWVARWRDANGELATMPQLLVPALNRGLVRIAHNLTYPLFDEDSLLFRTRQRFLWLAEFTQIAALSVIYERILTSHIDIDIVALLNWLLADVPTSATYVLHINDRHLRFRHEPAAHLCGAVAAAVVDQHDFMAALDRERFDPFDQRADGLGAVVERNHKTKREFHR